MIKQMDRKIDVKAFKAASKSETNKRGKKIDET